MTVAVVWGGLIVIASSCANASRVISPAEARRAFPSTSALVRLESLLRPHPKSVQMEWSFSQRGSAWPSGTGLIIYASATAARQAAIVDRSGKVVNGVVCFHCETYRVANVLLLFGITGSQGTLTKDERRVLMIDLAKLGTPISP